jgi:hypothetical protein
MSRSGGTIIGLLLVPLLVGGCVGNLAVSEVQLHLAAGWIHYLAVTLPQVRIDYAAVATGLAALVGLSVGGHWFFSWLYSACGDRNASDRQSRPPRFWRVRWTAYVVILVLVAFTAGISTVGMAHQFAWIGVKVDAGGDRGK